MTFTHQELPDADLYLNASKQTKVEFEESGVTLTVEGINDKPDLQFEYVKDEESATGYNLLPRNTQTTRVMGVMGCSGYLNPVTGEINN